MGNQVWEVLASSPISGCFLHASESPRLFPGAVGKFIADQKCGNAIASDLGSVVRLPLGRLSASRSGDPRGSAAVVVGKRRSRELTQLRADKQMASGLDHLSFHRCTPHLCLQPPSSDDFPQVTRAKSTPAARSGFRMSFFDPTGLTSTAPSLTPHRLRSSQLPIPHHAFGALT